MMNTNLLLSHMKLKNVSTKDLADAQGWSMTTVYRKINGKTNFTAPEIQTCHVRLSSGLSAFWAVCRHSANHL